MEGVAAGAPLPASVFGAECQANHAAVTAPLLPCDPMLHLGEGLVPWGLDVARINPLGSLDVTRDDARVQVDAQGAQVALEACTGEGGAIDKGMGRAVAHLTLCLSTLRFPAVYCRVAPLL